MPITKDTETETTETEITEAKTTTTQPTAPVPDGKSEVPVGFLDFPGGGGQGPGPS